MSVLMCIIFIIIIMMVVRQKTLKQRIVAMVTSSGDLYFLQCLFSASWLAFNLTFLSWQLKLSLKTPLYLA